MNQEYLQALPHRVEYWYEDEDEFDLEARVRCFAEGKAESVDFRDITAEKKTKPDILFPSHLVLPGLEAHSSTNHAFWAYMH